MAYTQFAKDKPVITDTGGQVVDATRTNAMALRDAIQMGVMPNWTFTTSGGTAEQPDVITYANGVERLRLTITWGSTGGTVGNPTVIAYAYSGNSGGAYDAIATATNTYDSNGNMTGTTWS
ncbi:MAG TPA: hypothetical protein VGD46_05065 [Rhizobacter sp.]